MYNEEEKFQSVRALNSTKQQQRSKRNSLAAEPPLHAIQPALALASEFLEQTRAHVKIGRAAAAGAGVHDLGSLGDALVANGYALPAHRVGVGVASVSLGHEAGADGDDGVAV